MASSQTPGSFSCQSLPSLVPSSTSTIPYHTLPHPRSSGPLKPGSSSESKFIMYLDDQLLQVARKHAKKYYEGGYATIKVVIDDLERLVDIIWVSSTPTLQTPYLLQMANSFNDYLASFHLQLKPTLRLLDTLDRCFYMLITGSSSGPSTALSPALSSYRMSMTEKVRLKSVVERTRLHVIKLVDGGVLVSGRPTSDIQGINRTDDETEIQPRDEADLVGDDIEDEEWEMEVAKVYDRSLAQIGESLKEG